MECGIITAVKKLSEEAGLEKIKEILKSAGRELTTWEIDAKLREAKSLCPDDTVVFLAKMRQRGLINGEISMEKRGWVWWIDDRDAYAQRP